MNVKYDPDFFELLKKQNVRVRKNFKEKILLFTKDPHNSKLNNHLLKREWAGHNSIDITSDYRAIYKEKQVGDEIVAYFIEIGTHKELYKPPRKN